MGTQNDEIAQLVRELHTSLIGTEQLPGAIPKLVEEVDKLQKRTKRLEDWRNYCLGGFAAVLLYVKLKLGGHI